MKNGVKFLLTGALLCALPACAQEEGGAIQDERVDYEIARDAEIEGRVFEPADFDDEADPFADYSEWRTVEPENLVLITTRYGVTAIELNTDYAPRHAARMRELVRAEFYDGERFYRVIDGFVAQAGVREDEGAAGWAPLKNENDRPWGEGRYTPLENPDLFAYEVGHSADSFPMARDIGIGREWLLHCAGAMAMARDNDPNSARTEFYIVLGAQRYLDRNLTVFGRVIHGMEHIQKLERGDAEIEGGEIQPPASADEMISVRIAADLPAATRPVFEVLRAGSEAFEAAKTAKRVRDEPFFYRKPHEILDICQFQVPVRRRVE